MKNSRLALLAGTFLIGASLFAGSGCATGGGIMDQGYILRRQLQAHGEFHGQDVFKYMNQLLSEMHERYLHGEIPGEMNVNQYYDWKKQQEAYEQELKAREDALKAIESGKKY